jgi:cyclophilin family peptidyl-prolyl cis-trans isomerase
MKIFNSFLLAISMAAVLSVGCAKAPEVQPEPPKETNEAPVTTPEVTEETTEEPAEEPAEEPTEDQPAPANAPADGEEVGVITTEKGTIVVKFFPKLAPNHVKQFKHLISNKFYDGTRFHRCMPGFMIQGGDPKSKNMSIPRQWGTGGYEKGGKEVTLKQEFSDVTHKRGILSTARGGHSVDSASSQFFIMHEDSAFLDNQYTVWGEVVTGQEVVDEIVKTGEGKPNGSVNPDMAIVLKTFRLEKWPL